MMQTGAKRTQILSFVNVVGTDKQFQTKSRKYHFSVSERALPVNARPKTRESSENWVKFRQECKARSTRKQHSKQASHSTGWGENFPPLSLRGIKRATFFHPPNLRHKNMASYLGTVKNTSWIITPARRTVACVCLRLKVLLPGYSRHGPSKSPDGAPFLPRSVAGNGSIPGMVVQKCGCNKKNTVSKSDWFSHWKRKGKHICISWPGNSSKPLMPCATSLSLSVSFDPPDAAHSPHLITYLAWIFSSTQTKHKKIDCPERTRLGWVSFRHLGATQNANNLKQFQ